MIPRSIVPLLLVAIIAVDSPISAAGLMQFSVTQVRQLDVGAPAVRAYLDLTDSDGQPLDEVPVSSLSATLGEWPAKTVNVAPFALANQGVAYIFLVDVSRSLSPELFAQMVSGIVTWINGMNELDRAAIIAFGESSRLIVDFTGDKELLLAGLASLGPTDDLTLLHQALADALDLSKRLDVDLPGRRAIVVFSDGKDEGSAFQAEDILVRLRDESSPIYAIGYSRLRDPAERRTYLNLLQRFASNSGGVFFAAEETQFAKAYDSIRQTIRRVWIADFLCAECRADGDLRRLQVQVSLDGHVLSSGGSVRLLPVVLPAESETEELPAEIAPPVPEEAPQTALPTDAPITADPTPTEPSFELAPWHSGALVALLALILWGFMASRKRRRTRPTASKDLSPPPVPSEPFPEAGPPDPPWAGAGPRTGPAPRPAARFSRPASSRDVPPSPADGRLPKTVRLIVVRGSRKGRQYTLSIRDRAVIGRRSDCDCVLGEESGIDAAQFELLNEKGDLYILNLSNRMPTLLAGRPLDDKVRLTTDTLVGTGETVLRIVF